MQDTTSGNVQFLVIIVVTDTWIINNCTCTLHHK